MSAAARLSQLPDWPGRLGAFRYERRRMTRRRLVASQVRAAAELARA
jgi:hypothetical protein